LTFVFDEGLVNFFIFLNKSIYKYLVHHTQEGNFICLPLINNICHPGKLLYICNIVAKNHLSKQPAIRRIIAAVMLIVFAFSVTPTILLHNWVATHTDSVKKQTAADQQQVSKQLFNCHCDNIVAESPFTEPYKISLPAVSLSFSLPGNDKPVHIPEPGLIFHSLRGPPAV
jgi:hypothetical protein